MKNRYVLSVCRSLIAARIFLLIQKGEINSYKTLKLISLSSLTVKSDLLQFSYLL